MKLAMSILVCFVSINSYAEPKKTSRWPAQESPQIARNVIKCDFAQNNLEVETVEVFATVDSKASQIVLSNISSVANITAHGGFKLLSAGGELTVSNSTDIKGKINMAANSANFSFVKGVGTLTLDKNEIKATGCKSILK